MKKQNKAHFNINFLDLPTTDSNDKLMYIDYFLNYDPNKWKKGSGGASFVYIEMDKIYSLVINEHSKYGFNLMYEPSHNGNGCYSLGDSSLLNEFIEDNEENFMPVGTYISADKAWLVVEDFLNNPKIASNRIQWVSDDDIEWNYDY
ncbi:hypothetical protein [Phocoenobacter skyensis]|uniref:Immunity protein Imm1 n=1 Tax=Phocoenobacter skyensis TaxID=97481 RepID=A0A1H7TUS3_9PAST|nr:hypothetical protein [Pasteurella skyensis]MDP8078619.1 hypothetical protein [Pasteurella skyensis]MDP8084613.1 hypothetical protein [Pasteurella skyensis]MDP8170778.1 hypothetical protein [Pasteurella skyensis]MDP8174903.1 hypothetical protein [Pasteurella skyensis]MDP8184241.1 hypothetical protein [Pasteurella skyensis]